MATTKRPNRKETVGNMPSRVKMINLEKEKISPAVRKLSNAVDTELKNQAKMSNIPVLKLFGTSTLTAESFFLNHTDYVAILGKNADILDRMMMSSICTVLTDEIMWSIEHAKVSYVGVWDKYTVYSILAATVTFMKHDTTDELYLTAHQYAQISQEDLDKLNPSTYMAFSAFNVNRFVEQLILIRKVAVDTIAGIIDNKIPKAFLASNDKPLGIRLHESYASMMVDDMREMMGEVHIDEFINQPATERAIRKFMDYFETPFLTMLTLLLHESGLSENLINMALGTSRIHIIFDDPAAETKLGDINIIYSMVSENLPEGIEPVKLSFTISIKDAVAMAMIPAEKIARGRREAFGKGLRTLILQACTYMINIYTKLMAHNAELKAAEEKSEAIPAADPGAEGDDVSDIDIEDLTKLLTE